MKWVADSTGRFKYRPHYDPAELDGECERLVSAFLLGRYGTSRFPISTDDLSVMIEQDTSDLDLYADLSAFGADIEGMTEFFSERKPAVKIAKELSLDSGRQFRLRTTLAHEYGHVKFHRFLWDNKFHNGKRSMWETLARQRARYERFRSKLRSEPTASLSLPVGRAMSKKALSGREYEGPVCDGTAILDAPFSDWMEWQASYVSGAILMPASALRELVRKGAERVSPDQSGAAGANSLTASVAAAFDVSAEAARVRLTRLGLLE